MSSSFDETNNTMGDIDESNLKNSTCSGVPFDCESTTNHHPRLFFSKHLDVASGQYYHVNKATKERLVDTPKGGEVPLEVNHREQNEMLVQSRSNEFNKTKAMQKEQREFIIERKREIYRKETMKKQKEIKNSHDMRVKDDWNCAYQNGIKRNGCISQNWKKYDFVAQEVYDFDRNNPTIQLRHLSLNGNELESIYDIPVYCRNLQKLSLACNQIKKLDDSIGKLLSLTHLNLLRNGLESLPSSIGSLVCLQVLDVSNNALKVIPDSIQNLKQIKVLNFECNDIMEIPSAIGNMMCERINFSCNRLISLPKSIGQLKFLTHLLLNDNLLTFLPVELFSSKTLRVIHASGNRLTELPNAICNVSSTLECLWLDNNKLSALPSNFHLLNHLIELELEGNSEMVNPSIEIIVKGPNEVRKWCELNLARCDHSRQRNIIVAVQSILEQVGTMKIGGKNDIEEPHESVFEANVEYKAELYYQFVMPVFWSSFLPQLQMFWAEARPDQTKGLIATLFPYERWEVEQTLLQFQDAAGGLSQIHKRAKFKKCSCAHQDNGQMKKCPIKKKDYCCERSAFLLRKNIYLEGVMVERRRKANEEQRIKDAVEKAKKVATQYLFSDDGKNKVRYIAEQRVKAAHDHQMKLDDNEKYELYNLETDDKQTSNFRKNNDFINVVVECFPWNKRVEKEIDEVIVQIRNDFITKEIESSRSIAVENNNKLKMVLNAWVGLTAEEIFNDWKQIVIERKTKGTNDDKTQQLEQMRIYEEGVEKKMMATKEMKLWHQGYDEFQEIPFWQHSLTKEIQWKEPTIEFVLATSGWSFPRPLSKPDRAVEINLNPARLRIANSTEKEVLTAATNMLRRRKAQLERK